MHRIHTWNKVLIATLLGLTPLQLPAQAMNHSFEMPLSASFSAGTMENSDMNLKNRVMTAISFEALPGYRHGKLLYGLHLDKRWHQQQSSLADAGGTNLKGTGYLLGVGIGYAYSEKINLQGALDFIGE